MKNSNLINMYFIFEHKPKDIFSETSCYRFPRRMVCFQQLLKSVRTQIIEEIPGERLVLNLQRSLTPAVVSPVLYTQGDVEPRCKKSTFKHHSSP